MQLQLWGACRVSNKSSLRPNHLFFAVLSYALTADAHSGFGYSVAFANFTCGLIFLTLLSLCIGQILNHVTRKYVYFILWVSLSFSPFNYHPFLAVCDLASSSIPLFASCIEWSISGLHGYTRSRQLPQFQPSIINCATPRHTVLHSHCQLKRIVT